MHSHTTLNSLLCSAIYLTSFALAGNLSVSAKDKYAAYPWLFNDPDVPSVANLTGLLGDPADRKYTCLGKSVDDGAKAKDCLAALLRFPQDATLSEFQRRDEEGFVPTAAWGDRCYIRLMFTDETVRQDQSSWLYMHNLAVALINLCKRGTDHKVTGTVAFGEQGLLRLLITKAPPRNAMGENVAPDWRRLLADAQTRGQIQLSANGTDPEAGGDTGDDSDLGGSSGGRLINGSVQTF